MMEIFSENLGWTSLTNFKCRLKLSSSDGAKIEKTETFRSVFSLKKRSAAFLGGSPLSKSKWLQNRKNSETVSVK